MKTKRFNNKQTKLQTVSQKKVLKRMTTKTTEEKELARFIKHHNKLWKEKMKNFTTMTGKIGRVVGHP